MQKQMTEAQLQAKKENDEEHGVVKGRKKRKPSGFLLKQRAFLKMYLITLTEENRLYGHSMLELLRDEFKPLGYRPNHSEVYKALHDLITAGILEPKEEILKFMERQKVIYYSIKDKKKAEDYKKRVYEDMERSMRILEKGLQDNRPSSKPLPKTSIS